MTDSNNSEWLWRPHISRRAALRAAILGATIPGALYLAKAANSADAADDNIYIPGAPNFLELGYGWPGKEANAGKITYRQWSDALDIVGAGTTPGYRKVKIWDDLYVQGLLNLRAYIVDPEVPRTWTAFLYAKDVNGQSKPFWKDATGTAQPLVARSATLVVAASDASPRSKLGADFVCDGTADEVQIQAAINALSPAGGKVVLTEGTFTIAAPILIQDKCIHLQGQGVGAALADGYTYDVGATIITAIAAYNQDFITIRTSDASTENIYKTAGTTVSDLKIWQPYGTGGSAHGIHTYYGGNKVWHIKVNDVVVAGVGGIGFYLEGEEQQVSSIMARSCYSAGLHCKQADCVLSNAIIGGNCRNNGDAGAYLGSGTYTNFYVYGNARYGVHLEGGTNASRAKLSNFFVEDNAQMGLFVREFTDVAISNVVASMNGHNEGGGYSQAGILIENCNRVTLTNFVCSDVQSNGTPTGWQDQGLVILNCNDLVISGGTFYRHDREAICIAGGTGCIITGCQFDKNGQLTTNTYSDIKLLAGAGNSTGNRIFGCNFKATGANKAKYGIEEADANQDGNRYHDNTFDGNQQTKAIGIQGSNSRAYQNKGFATENNGTAIVASGSTYVDVTHGLARTPSTKDISVTPTNNLGNASKFWISNIGASTFRINVNTAPGATTATFAWQAQVL